MQSSKLFMTTAAAITVAAAATFAYAQTTPTETGQGTTAQSQGQMPNQMPNQTAPMNPNATMPAPNSTGSQTSTDSATLSTERDARADRN